MKQNNKVDITYLKTRALTRSISSDSHSIAERLWWLLYNSWTCPAPRSVTHVNSNHIIVLTDSHTTVTHHSPTRPDTRLYLKRKVIYHTRTNAFGQKFPHAERRVENATSSGNWRYLVKWLNTVFSVWCIFFTESKTKEKQGAGLNTSYPVSWARNIQRHLRKLNRDLPPKIIFNKQTKWETMTTDTTTVQKAH